MFFNYVCIELVFFLLHLWNEKESAASECQTDLKKGFEPKRQSTDVFHIKGIFFNIVRLAVTIIFLSLV